MKLTIRRATGRTDVLRVPRRVRGYTDAMITKCPLIEAFPYHVVAVIAPHPDDSCIAAGGLLYRISQELAGRCRTHVLVMTSGYRGVTETYLKRIIDDEPASIPWPEEDTRRIRTLLEGNRSNALSHEDREFLARCRTAIRRQEVEGEATLLGFVSHFLDLEIYHEHILTDDDEQRLSELLSDLRAGGPRRLLIVPGRYELHQTHRLASELVRKVVDSRHVGEYDLWAYDSPWSPMMPRPDIVVPMSREALQAKIDATCCHRSQLDRTPYEGIVEGTAIKTAAVLSESLGAFDVARALDLGPYAEVFEQLTRSVIYT